LVLKWSLFDDVLNPEGQNVVLEGDLPPEVVGTEIDGEGVAGEGPIGVVVNLVCK
jgi:hypothetical protein